MLDYRFALKLGSMASKSGRQKRQQRADSVIPPSIDIAEHRNPMIHTWLSHDLTHPGLCFIGY
jgi:hypothetical protein